MTLHDELRAMLAKARRYVQSATALRDQGDFDSAISRLYYSMFYCAEALLRAEGKTFSSHRAVISAFAQDFVKTGILPKDLHKELVAAFEKRHVSDYEFQTTARAEDVTALLLKAQDFIAATEGFLRKKHHV